MARTVADDLLDVLVAAGVTHIYGLVGDSLNASIGQGYVLATPLQLAVMAARIATGREVTPRLVKSSGLPAWDQAALRALQKTERLPRDIDGRVPTALIVQLKPKR